MKRRDFIRVVAGSAALVGIKGPFDYARAAITPGEKGIYITGISVATINGLNSTARIVRLDTNKGISGYGEVRNEDPNGGTELNRLKSTILGMNPTQVDKVFNAITAVLNPTTNWTAQTTATGAIAAVECACWDITGKVYNVPIWKLLGPKLRDGMRMYCDTPVTGSDPTAVATDRKNKGFTWFKTDLNNILSFSDYTTSPDGNVYSASGGTAVRIKDSGYTKWQNYIAKFRKVIGSAPLSADHFFPWNPSGGGNQLDAYSAIQAATLLSGPTYMDKNQGGWCEDIIPWHFYSVGAQIVSGVAAAGGGMNILTGEDMFGFVQAQEMINAKAVNYFHPDPTTFGGIHQTRLAATWAHTKGVRTALHNSQSVFAMIMCAHISAGIPDFLACEHHYDDLISSWFDTLVNGVSKPIMQNGYVPIPEGPGLGITPNLTAMASHGSGFVSI